MNDIMLHLFKWIKAYFWVKLMTPYAWNTSKSQKRVLS